jgi:hypothetical protein
MREPLVERPSERVFKKIGRFFYRVDLSGFLIRGDRLIAGLLIKSIDGECFMILFRAVFAAFLELVGSSEVSANPDKKALREVCKKKFQRNLEIERGGRD